MKLIAFIVLTAGAWRAGDAYFAWRKRQRAERNRANYEAAMWGGHP